MKNSTRASLNFAVAVATGLTLANTAQATLLLYEGFDYAPDAGSTTLSGKGATNTLGMAGTWSDTHTGAAAIKVYDQGSLSGTNVLTTTTGPNTFDGTVTGLPTSGGYFGMGGTNATDHMLVSRPLASGFAAANFTDGSTTWFSFVSVRGYASNPIGMSLFLSEGTLQDSNFAGGKATGEAIGGGGGGGAAVRNAYKVYPQFFDSVVNSPGELTGTFSNYDVGGIQPGSTANHPVSAPYSANGMSLPVNNAEGNDSMFLYNGSTSGASSVGAATILIGKIEWHANGTPDVISMAAFQPGTTMTEAVFDGLIAAQPNLSSANWTGTKPDLNQANFDTISLAGGKWFADEIRLSTTFTEVIGGTLSAVPEPTQSLGLMGLLGLGALLRNRRK